MLYITTGKLIEKLKKFDPDLPVGIETNCCSELAFDVGITNDGYYHQEDYEGSSVRILSPNCYKVVSDTGEVWDAFKYERYFNKGE